MQLDMLFSYSGLLALAGWALLSISVLTGRLIVLRDVVARFVIPIILAALYTALVAGHFLAADGGFDSLSDLSRLFENRELLLAGWIHYLAFDLFVGTHLAERGMRERMPRLVMIPILAATFLFGPAGMLAYAALRPLVRLASTWAAVPTGSPGPTRARRLMLRLHPDLSAAALFMLLVAVALALLTVTEMRTTTAASVWLKPLKFSLSLALHLSTLALFWHWLSPRARDGNAGIALARLIILTSLFELAYIASQAAFGEGSHYNVATPYTSVMYTLMGIGAVVLVSCTFLVGVLILRDPLRETDPIVRRGIAIGLVLSGGLGLVTGIALAVNGGHFVGTPTAMAHAIPFLGWSREVGDIRVSHFIGLHALQALPLVGWIASTLMPNHGMTVLYLAASVTVVVTAAALVQALAGLPLL